MKYMYEAECSCRFYFSGSRLERATVLWCKPHEGAGQMEARQALSFEARHKRDEELKRLIEVNKPKRRSMDDGGTEGA